MIDKNGFLKMVQEKMDANGAEKVSLKDLGAVMTGFSDAIRQVIADNETVRFGNIGSFSGVEKPARKARNPRTGETVEVPARSGYPKFKFSITTKNDSKD